LAGVLGDWSFVVFIIMALVTSLLAGPMMNWLLSAPGGKVRMR
jgi:hypothetical protein